MSEQRDLPTSRANPVYSKGIGLEKIKEEDLIVPEKTPEQIERERIKSDLQEVWLRYLNGKGGNETLFDEIVDYIIKSNGIIKYGMQEKKEIKTDRV